jgi:hypothetical protein
MTMSDSCINDESPNDECLKKSERQNPKAERARDQYPRPIQKEPADDAVQLPTETPHHLLQIRDSLLVNRCAFA